MITLFTRSVLTTLSLTALLCGAYPLVVTGVGRLLFSAKVDGGMIRLQNGKVVGSVIIGQSFAKPGYFHGRPSAAGANGYDAASSSGSNLGPTSQKLADGIKNNVESVLKENPSLQRGQIPVDMVTASASGLDPHISPENALAQADRVAKARGISSEQVNRLIQERVEGPQLGLFGEPVVNVLLLNLDMDRISKGK